MTNQRRLLLVLLPVAVVVAASWLLLRADPEPSYQGKPLGWWLRRCDPVNAAQEQRKAAEALRAIGTNAIPTLLRLLNAEDSKFKLQLLQLAEKQRVINLHPKRTEFRRFEAKFGLICLGPEAKSAVPVLMEIYREHRPGPYDDPRSIAEIFTAIGPAAADAVPLLVQDTTNTDLLISCCAVQTLGEIHARPELTVPTLTMSLHGPGESIRALAAQGLAAFGGDARAAVPDLVIALSDPSSRVSAMAASALKKINRDPSAAQSAADPFNFNNFR